MRRPGRTVLGWAVLALLGVALAAAAGYAASRLATEPIGLSSEPITVGRELAPAAKRRTPTAMPTRTAEPTPSATAGDDGDRDADDD
jgi:hypothetical protein